MRRLKKRICTLVRRTNAIIKLHRKFVDSRTSFGLCSKIQWNPEMTTKEYLKLIIVVIR